MQSGGSGCGSEEGVFCDGVHREGCLKCVWLFVGLWLCRRVLQTSALEGAAHPSFCGRSLRFDSLDAAVRKRPSDAFVFVEQNLACSVRCIQMNQAAVLNFVQLPPDSSVVRQILG